MDFGIKLRKLREAKGWDQGELARESDISQGLISHYETGKRRPGYENIVKISKALGVDLEAFEETIKKIRPKDAEDAPRYKPNDIPEVGLVQAGRGGFFDPEGHPMGDWPRKFHRPEDVSDPNAYVVRVQGDSMEPFLKNGHRLMCVTNQEAVPGDMVVVQLKNDEFMVKELTLKDGMIILKSLNPLHEPIVLNKKEVRAIHPVVWIKRK